MIMMLRNAEWLIILRNVARTRTEVLFLPTQKVHSFDITPSMSTIRAVWISELRIFP